MTDEPMAVPPPPPQDPPPAADRRLTRAADDKVLTGLCGGLGRYFGIDPVIFRVAFVVLSLVGGTGIVLYLLGSLLVPDDAGSTPVDRFVHGRARQLALAMLIGVGIVALFGGWDGRHRGDFPVALALIGIGAAVLLSRRNRSGPGPGPVGSPTAEVAPPPPPPPPSGAATAEFTTPVDAPVPAPSRLPKTPKPPKPPKLPKPRSALIPVTCSSLLVLGGVLALLKVTLATGLAIALLFIGGAMVVGAWRGRARGLIPVAALLALGLGAASVMDVPMSGGIGERRYRPASADEIRSTYRLGIGEIVLDLRDVNLAGRDQSILLTDGIGHLEVIVPPDVEVEAIAHAGAGDVRLFETDGDGSHVDRTVVSPGGVGAGRLMVRARVGIGQVEVRRAAA